MLKSLIQLVPFGIDENSKVISGFYIANVGYSEGCNYEGNFDYVVGYFEKASKFTKDKPVAKFRLVCDWNNQQGAFQLLNYIYSGENNWWDISELNANTGMTKVEIQAIEIFKQRAIKDGIYE
jgi:hypothetical protein